MRSRYVMFCVAALVVGAGCEMQPMQKVKPRRGRVGATQVESAQREVDRTLEQYRRDREAAYRRAMQDSDE